MKSENESPDRAADTVEGFFFLSVPEKLLPG